MELSWLAASFITYFEFESLIIALLLDLYMNYRQYKLLQSSRHSDLPADLKKCYSPSLFDRSRQYELANIKYDVSVSLNGFIINTAYLFFYYYGKMWRYSTSLLRATALWPSTWDEELGITMCFYMMAILLKEVIRLPFSIYYNFVIEESYGFNRETVWLSIRNILYSLLTSLVLYCPGTAIVVYIVKNSGTHFNLFFLFWLHHFVMSVFLSYVYPWVIHPLYDDFTRLPENALRNRLEKLATRTGFPLSEIYIQFSKSTGHSNAYFTGVFTHKHIVLYDSLLKDLNTDSSGGNPSAEVIEEVAATVAHELGHWNGYHTIKNFVFGQLKGFVTIALFVMLYQHDPLFQSNGFTNGERPVYLAIGMVHDLTILFWIAVEILESWWSRKMEKEADFYAIRLGLGGPLKTGLCKDYAENLDFPFQDPLCNGLFGSHPTLLERIENIDEAMKTVQ